jgi:hypothetical protein
LRALRQLKTKKMCRKNSMRRRETPGLWMNTTAEDQLLDHAGENIGGARP